MKRNSRLYILDDSTANVILAALCNRVIELRKLADDPNDSAHFRDLHGSLAHAAEKALSRFRDQWTRNRQPTQEQLNLFGGM